jgi:uncharacterized protein DUF6286
VDTLVRGREARRRAAREFRPRRAAAALLAGLLVTALGGLLAAALLWPSARPPRLSWGDPTVLGCALVAATLGLGLLGAAVVPGRGRLEPLQARDPRLVAALSRGSLRQCLIRAVLDVPGITRASVRLHGRFRRRVVVVRATTHYRNPANITDLIHTSVTTRLSRIDPLYSHRVIVRLRWRKD